MGKKFTKEDFIKKSKKIHKDKFDYSLVIYKNTRTKVKIICKIHGEFEQTPTAHFVTGGCPKCGVGIAKRKNTSTHEYFLSKLPLNRNYKVISKYKRADDKVVIEDEYGRYEIRASNLMEGCLPSLISSCDKTEYIKKFSGKVHNGKYKYNKLNYKKNGIKVTITCPLHGDFKQGVSQHMQGAGCKKCASLVISKTEEERIKNFIEKAIKLYGNSYSYEKTKEIFDREKVIMTCKKHGDFKQSMVSHLQGGCPKCGRERIYKSNKENPSGWGCKYWEKASKKSKNFDSFKVYIIKCWSEEESFYKIGRTYSTVDFRFAVKSKMPYNYEVIKIIENEDARFVYDLENKLKAQHKDYKYRPKLKFGGMYECFSKIYCEYFNS